MSSQPMSERKLRSLLAYVAARLGVSEAPVDRVTLSTLIWVTDFEAYLRLGAAITSTRYVRTRVGVESEDERVALLELERAGVLVLKAGGRLIEMNPSRPALPQSFERHEATLINEIVDRYGSMPTGELLELVHRHPGYNLVETGDQVPYDSVFLSREQPPEAAVELGKRLIREGKWRSGCD